MRPGQKHFVYILTNKHKNVLYIGVTNNLRRRVYEHEDGLENGFSKKYNCHYLIHFEEFKSVHSAIRREKEIKGWRRSKKDALIKCKNPQLNFLNKTLKGM